MRPDVVARMETIRKELEKIEFHPDIGWTVDRYTGGPDPFGHSPHVIVRFEWMRFPDPKNQPTGTTSLFFQDVLMEQEFHHMREGMLRSRLLSMHNELWLFAREAWTQPKKAAHLEVVK